MHEHDRSLSELVFAFPDEQQALRHRVISCEDCRAEAYALLATLAEIDNDSELVAMLDRLLEEVVDIETPRALRPVPLRRWGALAGVAALAAGVLFLVRGPELPNTKGLDAQRELSVDIRTIEGELDAAQVLAGIDAKRSALLGCDGGEGTLSVRWVISDEGLVKSVSARAENDAVQGRSACVERVMHRASFDYPRDAVRVDARFHFQNVEDGT